MISNYKKFLTFILHLSSPFILPFSEATNLYHLSFLPLFSNTSSASLISAIDLASCFFEKIEIIRGNFRKLLHAPTSICTHTHCTSPFRADELSRSQAWDCHLCNGLHPSRPLRIIVLVISLHSPAS